MAIIGRGRGGIGWREAMGKSCPYGIRGLGYESMAPTARSAVELLEVEPAVREFQVVEDTGLLTIEEEEPKKGMPLLLVGGAILAGLFFMKG